MLSENEDAVENRMLDNDEDELFSDDRSLHCASLSTSAVSIHSKFNMDSYCWFFYFFIPQSGLESFKKVVDCFDFFHFSASIDPGFIPQTEDADMDTPDVCDFGSLTDNHESSEDEKHR